MGFKGKERGLSGKEYMWPLETGRSKEEILPRAFRKEGSPAYPLILAQWDPFLTSNLQSYEIINLYCFKQDICNNLLQQ